MTVEYEGFKVLVQNQKFSVDLIDLNGKITNKTVKNQFLLCFTNITPLWHFD